jgi:hypothetical protein
VPSNPRPTLRVEVTTREKEHLREPPADGVFVHGVNLEGAAWYVAPPPFVNSASVPSCSTLFDSVLLACLVIYVAPPPFVNSDVIVNSVILLRSLLSLLQTRRRLPTRATLAVHCLHRFRPLTTAHSRLHALFTITFVFKNTHDTR